MQNFIMKPVQAVQLNNNPDSIAEAIEFVFSNGDASNTVAGGPSIASVNQEGGMLIVEQWAGFGDWIVKDPIGDFIVYQDLSFKTIFDRQPEVETFTPPAKEDPGIEIGKQIRVLSDKLTGLAQKGSSMYSLEVDMRVDTEQTIYRTSIKKKI